MADPLRAALYIPQHPEAERWVHACTALAQMHDWHVASLVRDWDDLWELMCEGLVDIGIVGQQDHLPADRLPRVEVVDEQRPQVIPGPRRPQRLWAPGPGGTPPLS